MTLTAIARYFKVTRPSLHPKVYSKRNTCLLLTATFLMSTPFPISLMCNDGFFFHPGKFNCIYDCDKLRAAECLSMGTFLIIACYGPIVHCHICIFRSVRQHNIQIANSRREQNKRVNMQVDETKITKLLFAIVLAFTCCWSPLIVIDGVSMFTGKYWMPREVYMTYTYLVGYSSSVNPVIYGIFNPQLRQELCQLLRCRRTRRIGAQ